MPLALVVRRHFRKKKMRQKFLLLTYILVTFYSCNNKSKEQLTTKETTYSMLKLYKSIDNQLHYWETWDKDTKTAIIHWGIVGQRGQTKEVKSGLFSNFRKTVQKEVDEKITEGYDELSEDEISTLEIEYIVDGFGTEKDLDKRQRLQDKMDDVLGWTGLGHVDGGSSGSGTMEVCCLVVDFDIAKRIIEESLKGTEFSNYTRIYEEEKE